MSTAVKNVTKIVTHRGMGFLPMLTLILVGAKVLHLVAFSWWWVFAPMWFIPALLLTGGAVCLFGFLALFALAAISDYFMNRTRKAYRS